MGGRREKVRRDLTPEKKRYERKNAKKEENDQSSPPGA